MTLETREPTLTETDAASARTASPILVLGMHRGGTSAFAGMLKICGFELGSALMEPAQGVNDRGFWEHLDAFRIHERLLASLGRSRFDPREMPAGWREHPAFHIAVDEVRDLVRRDFAEARYWAIKDPRMCRIAPVWLEALASLGIAPRVVLIVRQPAEVARSMQAQRWIASTARAHLCWLQHMLEAEEATRGIARSLVTYDALLADWRTERARIADELEFEWPTLTAERAATIDAFLDPRERRFRAVEPTAGIQVPALAAELYDAAASRDESVWQRIADIGGAFRRGAAAFGPCLDEAIVEASLAFIEVGQGRIDAAARVDRGVELAAAVGESLDARLSPLREAIAQTSSRIDAIDARMHEVSAGQDEQAARQRESIARESASSELAQRNAGELHSMREAVAALAVELGKLRALAESRFSLRRWLRKREP